MKVSRLRSQQTPSPLTLVIRVGEFEILVAAEDLIEMLKAPVDRTIERNIDVLSRDWSMMKSGEVAKELTLYVDLRGALEEALTNGKIAYSIRV